MIYWDTSSVFFSMCAYVYKTRANNEQSLFSDRRRAGLQEKLAESIWNLHNANMHAVT